jgi:hypothetical protein
MAKVRSSTRGETLDHADFVGLHDINPAAKPEEYGHQQDNPPAWQIHLFKLFDFFV